MRLVFLADTHGNHHQLDCPPGDVLIHAGDLTTRGSVPELESMIEWLSRRPHEEKILVAGNHDFCLEHSEDAVEMLNSVDDIHFLQDESIEIRNLKFWGSPWTPEYGNWAFQRPRGEPMKNIWSNIPTELDVLITHGPPRGIGDQVRDGSRVGCEKLSKKVSDVGPTYHVFGHIHEGYGVYEKAETMFINASVCTFTRGSYNDPIVRETDAH